jgi:hypothetical protein
VVKRLEPGDVLVCRDGGAASEAQMGGTIHAASAAPARMPSENTAMATAVKAGGGRPSHRVADMEAQL